MTEYSLYFIIEKHMKLLTLLILYLLIFSGCGPSRIPEITGKLRTIPVTITTPKDPLLEAVSYKDSMAVVYKSGKIIRIKTATGIANRQFGFKTGIDSLIIHRNQYMVFSNETGELFGFDMNNMRSFNVPKDVTPANLRLTASHMITTDSEKITVTPILKSGNKITINLMEEEMLRGAHINDHQLHILTTDRLLFVNTAPRRLQAIDLKEKATSDFVYRDGSIYYGTLSNKLIRLDIVRNRIKWKYKLSSPLRSAPILHSGLITIIPEDSNLYTLNTRGSLINWYKLSGKPYYEPIKMAENICILTDGPPSLPCATFYNPVNGHIIKEKFARLIISQPQYSMNELYIVFQTNPEKDEPEATEDDILKVKKTEANENKKELSSEELRKTLESSFKEEEKLTSLEKTGNRYDVELISDPENYKLAGRSVNYRVVPVNFIKPYIDIAILNQADKKLFTAFFAPGTPTNFTWIPEEPGDYKIRVIINSKNRNEISLEYPVRIFNADKVIKDYYLYIQNYSNENGINNNDPAENFRFPEKKEDKSKQQQ